MLTRTRRLLLDTHVFLWWRADDTRLRPQVRNEVAEADTVFVSAASAWEAAIKAALGALRLPDSVEAGVVASGFEKLAIQFSHVEAAARLPHHHRDPFDRLLAAQARIEGLTLVTGDRRLQPYDLSILWA